VLRLTREVERVGDYAVGIARATAQFTQPVSKDVARDFEIVAADSQHLLRQAMRAFNESNAELARATKQTALHEHAILDKVYEDLMSEGERGSRRTRDLFGMLFSFTRLARITDQAKNICEDTLFAATGEAKGPKHFQILFLDEKNDCRSVMAEAIARKNFPETGRYESAGWQPAKRVRPEVLGFLDRHGQETSVVAPRAVDTSHRELATYHLIISLEGDARAHLPAIPFYTTLLEWEVGASIGDDEAQLEEAQLEEIYKGLSVRIRDLMMTLRGELAS